MIDRAILLKRAYSRVCADDEDLAAFGLEDQEWRYLRALSKLLEPFYRMTTTVSSSTSYPSIPLTIAGYNKLIDMLEDFQSDQETESYPDMREAADTAKKRLLVYYGETDKTPIYAVATAMFPWMRFDWWTDHEWGAVLENQQKQVVRSVFANAYQQRTGSSGSAAGAGSTSSSAGSSARSVRGPMGRAFDTDDLFGPRARSRASAAADELTAYVSFQIPENYRHDEPLQFWKNYEKMWPTVAKMARDYLAIPTTSTPAERIFSRSRAMLPYQRNRMGNSRLRELMLTHSWLTFFD